MKTFDFISDPGHGWVKVPVYLLSALNIADKISHYSYFRAGYGYLEEDCDLSVFFNAYRARYGHDPKLRDRISEHSRVRNYERYDSAKHTYAHHLAKLQDGAALRINAVADPAGVIA